MELLFNYIASQIDLLHDYLEYYIRQRIYQQNYLIILN